MIAPSLSRSDHEPMSFRPRRLVAAVSPAATNAVARRTDSSDRTTGAISSATTAVATVPRERTRRARAMSHRVSVDQKYASGSGISIPV